LIRFAHPSGYASLGSGFVIFPSTWLAFCTHEHRMTKPPDRQFDVAIIGGGFAGVYCARELLARTEGTGLRVVVIANENHMVF
jgi:NADH dehydrogenase